MQIEMQMPPQAATIVLMRRILLQSDVPSTAIFGRRVAHFVPI
jgi:hypothetical protein